MKAPPHNAHQEREYGSLARSRCFGSRTLAALFVISFLGFAVNVYSQSLTLSWQYGPINPNGSDRPAGTEIFRQRQGETTFSMLGSVNYPVTGYIDNLGLTYGQSVTYKVREYNAIGISGYSNIATGIPQIPPPALTPGPATLACTFTLDPIPPPPQASLMAAYSCNEGSGLTIADTSGNGHTGTLTNGPLWIAGHAGSALKFDGMNDYVNIPNIPSLPAWTVEAWIKGVAAPANGPSSGPIHRRTNYQLIWNDSYAPYRGAAVVVVHGVEYSASFGPLAGNTWYYLAATYDGETLKTYKNGVLVTSNTAPSGPADSESASLKLGRHATVAQYWAGTVDEVRIYNRALSVSEIQADMAAAIS